jgi:transcriptional regulator with XRE-family HTH domain
MSVMQVETDAIAGKVRGIAHEFQLTQQAVADVLGLERKAVSARWGGRVPFTGPELLKLSRVCGVPIARLFPEPAQTMAALAEERAS